MDTLLDTLDNLIKDTPSKQSSREKTTQQKINKFWKTYTTKSSSKPYTILPQESSAKRRGLSAARSLKDATVSYEEAAAACKLDVKKIVEDCQRRNQKHVDCDFDIESDFGDWLLNNLYIQDCLTPLGIMIDDLKPGSVKRVERIFENPQFFVDDLDEKDVRQGNSGDCWFMGAVCALGSRQDLLRKICVARDEKIGVYGFVFYRDGEWIHEVVDDKLYLAQRDYHMSISGRHHWQQIDTRDVDEKYRKVMQTGSDALYFAKCKNPNATWLPLLQKAYAKAHGDYGSIEGGLIGEGIEDLTGGVTTSIETSDILDENSFWTNELMNISKLYLFGLKPLDGIYREEHGIFRRHSYPILEARELEDGIRLLKVKNPWGSDGWKGPWSDGSEEWTAERMTRLDYTFGNDGIFWISFKDVLKNFQRIDRTRLFGSDWSLNQRWTNADVPWSRQYLSSHFRVTIPISCKVVLVLSQLDDRYFKGLEGKYWFQINFQLHRPGHDDFVAESNVNLHPFRSVSRELDLEAGQYTVLVQIIASKDESKPKPEQVIVENTKTRPAKLVTVGRRYEFAHGKGGVHKSRIDAEERLRQSRRDKRKLKAKKEYERTRLVNKKMKLVRLRKEAWYKAKGKTPPKSDEEIKLSIKRDGSTLEHTETFEADSTASGTRSISHEGNGVKFKVSLDEPEEASGGDKSKQATVATGNNEMGDTTDQDTSRPSIADDASTALQQFPNLTLEDISDDELSWASDVDAPPNSSSSDSDDDLGPVALPHSSYSDDNETSNSNKGQSDKEKQEKKDPWNAVCTFGLRVYTQGPPAEIELVSQWDEEVEKNESGGNEGDKE
ncbi:MAG: hypothetical protein Q9202_007556 [Teloschistes flavicans]